MKENRSCPCVRDFVSMASDLAAREERISVHLAGVEGTCDVSWMAGIHAAALRDRIRSLSDGQAICRDHGLADVLDEEIGSYYDGYGAFRNGARDVLLGLADGNSLTAGQAMCLVDDYSMLFRRAVDLTYAIMDDREGRFPPEAATAVSFGIMYVRHRVEVEDDFRKIMAELSGGAGQSRVNEVGEAYAESVRDAVCLLEELEAVVR